MLHVPGSGCLQGAKGRTQGQAGRLLRCGRHGLPQGADLDGVPQGGARAVHADQGHLSGLHGGRAQRLAHERRLRRPVGGCQARRPASLVVGATCTAAAASARLPTGTSIPPGPGTSMLQGSLQAAQRQGPCQRCGRPMLPWRRALGAHPA